MLPNEIFKLIQNTQYHKSGIDVDWQVKVIGDTAYLLFQETRTKIDWKTNFDFLVKPYKNQESTMWVHRGFAKAYKSCNDEVMEAFMACSKNPVVKKYLITGWSYGGAMAQLAAEDFYYRTGIKASLVTFGAPKVAGGIKTRNHIRQCVSDALMFAHVEDIVTKIPPFYFKIGRNKIGKHKFGGLFHPEIYHCSYGMGDLY